MNVNECDWINVNECDWMNVNGCDWMNGNECDWMDVCMWVKEWNEGINNFSNDLQNQSLWHYRIYLLNLVEIIISCFPDDLGCILGTKSEKLQKKNKEVSSEDEEKGNFAVNELIFFW